MSQALEVETDRGRTYSVVVGERAVDRLGRELPDPCAAVALVTDSNLARLHRDRVIDALGAGRTVSAFEFPAGEQHKTRRTKERIEDAMLGEGFGRDCTVVALGGGVTTDIAGFVASTYMRGVPWIALPTSLLAAVDASVGGKTGVDTDLGKNLIGAFHQPRAVLIDLELMQTLPGPEVDNGLTEMLKHAVIADASYLRSLVNEADRLRSLDPAVLEIAIARSIEIKGEVVAADTEERDYRQVLNLGHTIGHAIELVSRYRVSHGGAVAAGLAVECEIAARLGLMPGSARKEVVAALERLGLPVAPPAGTDPGELLQATKRDKKGRAGRPRYALPAGIGEMARGERGFAREVPDDVVLSALEEA
jgi:3-dehydroquinate synthase